MAANARNPVGAPAVRAWERQPDEPDRAWAAFLSYREQPLPRALRRVNCAGMQIHALESQELFQRWDWKERCLAYDRHLDAILQEEREATLRRDVQERRAQTLSTLDDLMHLLQRESAKFLSKSLEFETETVNPAQLQRLLDTVLKWQQLLRGDPTERVENTVKFDVFDDMDPEEAKELKKKFGLT